jgi:hypothetical protein
MTANEIRGILFFTFSPPFKAAGWGYSSSPVYIVIVMVVLAEELLPSVWLMIISLL